MGMHGCGALCGIKSVLIMRLPLFTQCHVISKCIHVASCTALGALILPSHIAPVTGTSCGAAAGIGGYVRSLPAGYALGTAVWLSDDGINGAMHGWGHAM